GAGRSRIVVRALRISPHELSNRGARERRGRTQSAGRGCRTTTDGGTPAGGAIGVVLAADLRGRRTAVWPAFNERVTHTIVRGLGIVGYVEEQWVVRAEECVDPGILVGEAPERHRRTARNR